MMGAQILEVGCFQFELEIEINAPAENVWKAIIEDTNGWWLPDFHMVAADSTVEFDVSVGGKGLVEYRSDGSFLQWYSVQSYLPEQFKIYMVGNVAPDYGGPATTNLCLQLEEESGMTRLKVIDAHHGRVSEKYMESLRSGWQQLFSDGLKAFIEN